MSDEHKFTATRVLQIIVPIASVTIALASLFIGLSARRKELTCIYTGSEKLVSVSNNFAPDLTIRYHGEPVASLTKMSYVIRNVGAVAVKGTDVVEALQLEYPDGTKILSVGVDKTLPSEFSFSAAQSGHLVLLGFSLLNPGDEAHLGVYVYNSEPKYPRFRGRVVDVNLSQASDAQDARARPLQFISNSSTRATLFWLLIAINAALAVLSAGIWTYAFGLTVIASNWRRRWKARFLNAVEELKSTDSSEYHYISQRVHKLGMGYLSLNESTKKHLKQKGIPEPPTSGFDTATEALGYTVLFLGLATCSLFTVLYIYTAPR